ncbi:hypothetical protein ACLSZY_06755 [Avibacterium volantium]|uniref:hypothetical protein n=1 Tax=Avibacterium TaxID=292486 RepID=UPI0039FC81B9
MARKIDIQKVLTFIVIVLVSGIISYFAQPYIHDNKEAVNLIVNVFSIPAALLVAIMTLFSDFSINNKTNWREISLQKQTIRARSTRNKHLFHCYLIVFISVFISILLGKSKDALHQEIVKYAEYTYLYFASFALGYSLYLPNKIYQLKTEKLDNAIRERKPKNL